MKVDFGEGRNEDAAVKKVKVVKKKVVKNAKSTYEIEKNHLNLVEIQRRANFKKLQPYRKFQHCEMLHKLDETRRNVKKYIDTAKDDDDPSDYPFHPNIDKTSNEIMKNVNKNVLGRTYDWLDMKIRKNNEKVKEKDYKFEEDIKNTTIKHKPIPKSATATSKVRIFLETQQNNLNLTNTFKGTGGVNNQNPTGVIQYTGFQGQPMKKKKKAVHTFLDPISNKTEKGAKSRVLHNVGNNDKGKLNEVIGFYQGGNKPVDTKISDPRKMKMKEFKKEISSHLRDM
jgi:hypothetical protein